MPETAGNKEDKPAAPPPGIKDGAAPAEGRGQGGAAAAPSLSRGTAIPKRQLAALETLLGTFVKSSKTVTLYKDGHSMIGQIVGRVMQILKNAMGREHHLSLEIKAKQVLFDENELPETSESVAFAAVLHTLGVGEVLFTDRLQDGGMLEFLRILVLKADDDNPLERLQKRIQQVKIDGLTIKSIVSFVETDEISMQKPGELTEEQIAAFLKIESLPDFLQLLFKQNEPLTSKEGQILTALFDDLFSRGATLKEFEAGMPWADYDPRIRRHYDELLGAVRGRKKWDARALGSDLSLMHPEETEWIAKQGNHSAERAFDWTLGLTHSIMGKPAGPRLPKFALLAYLRLLGDLGRWGKLGTLLDECDRWREMASSATWAPHLGILRRYVQENLATEKLAGAMRADAVKVEEGDKSLERLHDFVLTLGRKSVPLLLEELRKLEEKGSRQRLAAFLSGVCRRLGGEDLVSSLKDGDYFFVVLVIGILSDVAPQDLPRHLRGALKYEHGKVRRAAIQGLRRFGGADSAKALSAFITMTQHVEEARLAVTALSLISESSVPDKLVAAYGALEDYQARVAIVMALGRFPSHKTREFLAPAAKRSFVEWLTGRNSELRRAARESLVQVEKELSGGA